MKESETIEATLNAKAPKLSAKAQADLWQAIEAKLNVSAPIVSPYSFAYGTLFNVHKKTMVPIMLALVVLLGAGGTVAASESAKPGDILFPIDRAVEQVRLALIANDDARSRLQEVLTEERFHELQDILEEEQAVAGNGDATAIVISDTTSFEAEADVFTDVTVVKVEVSDQKTIFSTSATTTAALVTEIATRFTVSEARVAEVLDVEVEDRASRPSDTVRFSASGEARVGVAVSTMLDFLEDDTFSSEIRSASLLRLVTKLDEIQGGVEVRDNRVRMDDAANRIEIRNDRDDSRIEIENGEVRIRVREKDGEVRVDVDDNRDDLSDVDNDWSNDDDARRSTLEVEADVYGDMAVVKVEINDVKTTFETSAKTETAIAAEVATRFGVAVADVLRVLEIEIEDGASDDDFTDSHEDDGDSSSDDDSSGDSDDEQRGVEKFEVRVEDGAAEVRVAYDGKELEFETVYVSKAALLSAVAIKTGLSVAVLEASLDLEVKD